VCSHEVAAAAEMRGAGGHHCLCRVPAASVAAFADRNIWNCRSRDLNAPAVIWTPRVTRLADIFASEYSALLARRLLEKTTFDIEDELKKVVVMTLVIFPSITGSTGGAFESPLR
jgi:hypothetical protein